MIKLEIDNKILKDHSLSLNGLFVLLKTMFPEIEFTATPMTFRRVVDQGFLVLKDSKFQLTEKGEEVIKLFVDPPKKKDEITMLAEDLRSIYPPGKKQGKYYWKGSMSEITRKLTVFFRKYGNKYTGEDVINATRNYVNSFGERDMDKGMQLLKYFIEKNGTSTLTSFLDIPTELKDVKIDYGMGRDL